MQNKYKKFFITTLIISLSSIILSIIGLYYFGEMVVGKKNIKYVGAQGTELWLAQKREISKNLQNKNPRIIFLAGSNGLYGIDADRIERETNITTINNASHAGLASYIFFNAKRFLKSGDTLILPLEYEYYLDSYEINPEDFTLIEYVIGYDSEYFKQMPLKLKLKTIRYIFKLSSIVGMNKKFSISNKLTARGSFIHKNCPDIDYEKDIKPLSFDKESFKNSEKWELSKFLKWCNKNGIKVYATAPNAYHTKTLSEKEKIKEIEIKDFYEKMNAKFIGNMSDGFFEFKDMYDTSYHINESAQRVRTQYFINFINDLKRNNLL